MQRNIVFLCTFEKTPNATIYFDPETSAKFGAKGVKTPNDKVI